MKLMIYGKPTPEVPLQVRLATHPTMDASKSGVTMQVYYRNTWLPVCTLREDGKLGLWDVRNQVLKELGFDMSLGHIATCTQ